MALLSLGNWIQFHIILNKQGQRQQQDESCGPAATTTSGKKEGPLSDGLQVDPIETMIFNPFIIPPDVAQDIVYVFAQGQSGKV